MKKCWLKLLFEYSTDMDDTYENIEKCKILILFDDMIADMLNNRKRNAIVTDLFIRGRKRNISRVFIVQSNFAVPTNIRPNTTHYFIVKIQKDEVSTNCNE